MRPASTFVATVIALALAGVAFAGLGGSFGHHRRSSPKAGLKVSGHVGGLYPGAIKPFRVRVKSDYPFPIRVRSLRAVIFDAALGCSRSELSVTSFSGRLTLAPHGSRRLNLLASMSPSAMNACQGAVFPLRFKARASR
jgi:hypothetical protein